MLTRTDRRRFPILLAVIAALAMAMLFSPVQAQEGSAPDQPTGLEATATHDSVTLTWDDPQDDTITGYVILRRVPGVDPQGHFSELVSDTATAATTYTDDTVAAETRYTYRIKAINEHGVSERSRWSHINVPAAPEAVEGDDPDEQDGEGDGGGAPGGPGKRANVSEPSDGDCPGDVSTTCEVDVGGSVTGNISSRTDFDWFRVDLEADTRYQIDLEGEDTGRGTLPDPSLKLRDTDGSHEEENESSGVGDNAREIYTPTATGTYYVGTGEVDGETGTYTLSVIVLGANGASEQDTDFPETTATTGRVEVGASATGNIESGTDRDWFRLDLEAGKTYQIDLEGDTGGGGTLGDPYLRNIRDSSGTEISGTENDDIVGGVADSRVVFTPTADGAYYLVASGFDGTYTGTYTLSVTELETRTEEGDTDFANDVTTLGRVEVGGSATGEIENVADSDWFRVVLEKDKTYVFDLEGTETSSGTLADPLLLLRDASGSTLEGDDDGGDGANSRLEYTATADGIHYLTATTPTSATSGGTYTLSVSEVLPCTLNEGDIWCGVVDVGEVRSTADVLTGHGFVGITGRETGGLAGHPDDTMFSVGDNDYTIQGIYVGAGTNNEGALFLLLTADLSDDDEGILVLAFDGVTTLRPLDDATKLSTGLYQWSTDLDWSSTTEVTVRLQTPSDCAAGTTTTCEVAVGGSVTGNIGTATDADWFKVVLEAGKTYQIDLEGMDTGRGTLPDPWLALIADADGNVIPSTGNADGGVGKNARTILTPTTAGAYYVVARTNLLASTVTGTYTLSVIVLGANGASEADTDCRNDDQTTCEVDVGGSVTGNIGSGDQDWFKVVLEADKTYQIDMEGSDTSGGTLTNPELLNIRDSETDAIADTGNDDIDNDNDEYNSQVVFTPTEAGDYYLVATSANSGTGTYTLSVSEITPADDDDSEGSTVLVSNIEEFHDSESNLYDEQMLAQAFSIAADSGDYTLTSIEIPIVDNGIAAADIESLSVSVWSTDSSGEPSASLHTLTNPGSITADTTATFNAQPGMTLTLEAGNTYAVLVRYDKALSTNFPSWASTEEYDQSGAVGWEIADESLTSETDNVNWVSSDLDIYRMRINGSAASGGTPAACTLNEGDIWCGVVTVGDIANDRHGFLGMTGGLSDETFSLMFETGTTNNYTILAIQVASEQLYFVTDSGLTDTEVESLALHVDGESDPFVWSDSTAIIPRSYRWPARTGLDWSSETTVTLRLREFPRPRVTNVAVTSTPVLETDTYGAGETIEVSVTFSEAVDATSDTDFELNVSDDKSAPLVDGSGTETLVFGYTVAPDEEDDNGIWIGDQDRTLVGSRVVSAQSGTITSVATSATADLTHDALRTQPDHKVDGTRSIVSVEVTSEPLLETDTYGAGETIQFTVTFTAAVDVTGDPVLEFLFDGSELRQAGDVSGSGTTELVFGYTVVSGDDDDNGLFLRDESDYNNPDGPVRLDSNDEIEFKDTSTDVPLYWQGRGNHPDHKVDGSRTTGNNPPSFTTSATLSIPENTSHLTVVAEDNDAGDDITGYAITGGADNLFFAGVDFGDLQFDAAPNYENPQDSGADNTYEVTVQATSGTGTREMTATRTFTVTVTDVAEQSAKPDKPTLAAVSGSTTSLTATWTKPDLNGGPDITGYDLQYRAGATGTWSSSTSYGATVTTATITGLTADTSYQARVLAKNGETDSDWSDASDAVSTNAAVAMMPLDVLVSNYPDGSGTNYSLNFHSTVGANQRHYFAQTFTAGAGFTLTAVDIPFRRVPDNSRVTVSLHARNGSNPGTYLGELDLSGALAVGDNTFAAPAGTALASGTYFVRVRWRDGDTNSLSMTNGVDDEMSAESGWSIEDRAQYSASGSSWSNWNTPFAMRVRGTIDGVPRVATGGVRIESDPDAHDSYGVGEEIEVAVGFTDDVAVDTTSSTPRVALTVGSNTRYADYSASDSDDDELAFVYTVTEDDHDQDGVSIDADALELNGGAIHKDGDTSTNAVLDHADLGRDSDHRVNRDPFIVSDGVSVISTPVAATDTYGLGEVIEIEVEFSAAVDATTDTDFVLSVAGAKRAPLLRGSGTATLVFGYTVVSSDEDDDGIWIGEQDRTLVGNRNGEPQNGEITSAVTDRAADLDHDSPGVLSGHKVDGSRTTDNVAPSFTSLATFDAAENQTAAGTVVAADSDSDDSVTGYEITGGADQALFEIGATSGELTFKSAPNFEDPQDTDTGNDYEVTVQATSGTDTREMTADQTITVTVTDVDTEAPGKPGTPTVSAGSATSLRVNWSAPSNAGPPITGYDVRHRTSSPEGSWTEKNVPSIAAVIDNLSENTSYQVQVRATNAEGTGAWSDSGSGTTDAAASDDCTDDTTTTCEVDVGGSVTGTLETAGDSDWFKVVLEAGTRYQIDLEGADTGRGTLPNPGAILYNRSSANVAFDVNGGVGDNARVIYTPTAAGAHYVQANTASGTGIYTLSVIVLGANGNSEADTDFPNNNTTTGKVEVGASATGNVESAADRDWFAVDLEAGKRYQFDLEGAPNGRGTQPDPFLLLYDRSATAIEGNDDLTPTNLNSAIVYDVTATGTYYLVARGARVDQTGTYTLSVRDITPAALPDDPPAEVSETEEEDLAADTSTSGVVEVDGDPEESIIRAPVFVERTGDDDVDGWDFDTDWFAVELEAGRTYRIDMKGALLSTDSDLTLRLPQINAIYDEDGEFLVNTWSLDESDSHYLFRVTFHAHDDGTYYIAASGESHEWGSYELTVIDITEDYDEHTGAAPPRPKNLRAVEEKGGVRLTWQPPDGAAVTCYRIERRRAGGQDSGPQRSHGQPRDHHTLVEDTGNTETGYIDESAEQGVEYEYRVTARNESGPGEESDWVRAGPEEEPVLGDALPGAPRNLTATPGNREVTLSWDPPDDNGNPPATRYRIEWRVDGKDYDRNDWGTSQETTYTTNAQANLANGVKYFFRVKAENDDGNSYGPYGPSSEEVSSTPTSGSAVDLGTPVLSDTETLHHGIVKLDWQDIEDAGWYVVQYYHVEDEEWLDLPAEGVDIAFHGSSAVVSNLHGLSWLRVGAASCDGASEWSQIEELYGTNASDWEGVPVPEVEEGDEIEPCPVVLGTPVLSDTEILHHGMVQLDWQDIEDAGWYVVQYYHIDGGGGEWLDLPAAGVEIAFHGTSAVVSNLHGLSWLRVRAMSCAGASEWSQIEQLFGTNASDWEGVPVPEVAEGDEIEPCDEDPDTPDNSPATGAPTISGTAQVGETLTANTSGIADADGRTNATFSYQWLADDADINGATGSTYTLADSDEGKAAKVRVSFTDDAGNHETLTSEATDAVAAATQTNSPVIGAPTISGTAQVGETLTANTSGIADADGLSNVQYEYQWLADDADISGATNATYTLVAEDEGKAIKVQVSFTDDEGNEESLTSGATDVVVARPNSPATGAPTIGGTAQVGQTLTADTSGITDADGLANATFSYQWTADDTDISGATGLTYTLTGSEESKAITVQVSFTDDADNEETLTSAATDVVAGAQPTEPPDQPTGLDATATHDSVTLTWDDPGDDSITGYVILRRVRVNNTGGDFSELVADTGTAATTYTDDTVAAGTTYTYRIKAINGAGTSERSRWFHIDTPAAPVPDKPTGLSATASHDSVTLTWEDPGDDSITGYVILRRLRYDDPSGHFDELVADTGTAATTYTDDTVKANTHYTYRIKAISGAGVSERSRWFHIQTQEAP